MQKTSTIEHQASNSRLVLIADDMHVSIITLLESAGYQPDYQPQIKRADVLAILPKYTGLIIRSKTPIDEDLLQHAPELKFIGRAGAGLDQIDVQAVEKRSIALFHAGEGNRQAVGEHAVGMILTLFNRLLFADQEVRKGIWKREENRGIELSGKAIGLIGYGNNGQATARCMSGFGCKVMAFDKYRQNYGDDHAQAVEMETIFKEADILSLHVPLTDETHFLVNQDFLGNFKKPIFLINVARGEIVSLVALAEALQNKKVLGACLDVLENEKLHTLNPVQQKAFDYLRQSEQVIFSPHVAGWTQESYRKINEVLMEKIRGLGH